MQVHWIHLSWRDDTANETMLNATSAWLAANQNSPGSGCNRVCDSTGIVQAGCCDGLFLPHIDLPNLLKFDYQVQAWCETYGEVHS